ncbi:hypothetical protein [Pelobacter seleniigenes]|uniref:hypothetical protein n=1 Tax=Pelobacter seleniigenes TaxID=407188 RepID=UPI0012B6D377|nr:hypothetical protein [Pelobacter seleniigenes]
MSDQYKDQFSEAIEEEAEHSAFLCTACNTKYPKAEAKKKDMTCCGRTMTELLKESFGP